VDLNPLAVRTAAANIALNRLEQRVLPVRARADQALQLPADLVLANIHFDVLQDLVTKPAFAAKERFILSGLLSRQGETIRDRLHSAGATIERSWLSPDGWATIVGRNDSSRHQEGGPHGHGPD
jgi:ribosomal protein L11 methyltransferase